MELRENEYGKYFIDGGILYFVCNPAFELDIDSARQIAKDLVSIQNGKKYPLCVDISGVLDTDKAGRDFMATESPKFCSSIAFIAESELSRIIGNFFLQVSKPLVPTKLFTDKHKALEYLHTIEGGRA
jgi:hypothetical protein